MPRGEKSDKNKISRDTGGKGGRPKGAINKTTAVSRECFAKLVEGNWHKMQGWLDTIAENKQTGARDAMDRMLIMAEFCVPKLARTELVSNQDAGLHVTINRADQPTK